MPWKRIDLCVEEGGVESDVGIISVQMIRNYVDFYFNYPSISTFWINKYEITPHIIQSIQHYAHLESKNDKIQ